MQHLSSLTVQSELDGYKSLDIVDLSIRSMRSFLCSIPDFQILTAAEQCSLLQRNWHAVSGLNFILITRDSDLLDSSRFLSDGAVFYGNAAVSRAKRLKDRLDLDSTLIKVLLLILAFSSNCLIMEVPQVIQNDSLMLGTFRLLGSQNVFVELLWKYMTYRYGHDEAVIRFDHLIKKMLDTIDHVTETYANSEVHQSLMNDKLNNNNLLNSVRSNASVPLWGNAYV
jgi:hypothetical protein